MESETRASDEITKNLQRTVAEAVRRLLSSCEVGQKNNKCNNNIPCNKPSIKGLNRMDENYLAEHLEAIRVELTAINSETLLTLDRVIDDEGAILQHGYDSLSITTFCHSRRLTYLFSLQG